jgi:hypothetical protein
MPPLWRRFTAQRAACSPGWTHATDCTFVVPRSYYDSDDDEDGKDDEEEKDWEGDEDAEDDNDDEDEDKDKEERTKDRIESGDILSISKGKET